MGTINKNTQTKSENGKHFPAGSVQLLWAKTKVYIHPSNNKKENISGILSLTRPENSPDKEIIVSWIPDFVVESRLDMEKFEACDMQCNGGNNETDGYSNEQISQLYKPIYIRKSVVTTMGSFAFSLEIQSIYSVQSRTPNLGLWWGSIIINSKSEYERLPVLFFHDNESESFKQRQKVNNKNFNPFSNNNGELFYGGDQFLDVLAKYCHLEKSSLENCIYLVNPSSEDLKAFSPLNVKQDNNNNNSKSPFNVMNSLNFNKMLNDTKWTILESLAKISYMTKNNVNKAIEENKDKIPEPIKKLLEQPEIQRINDEFETANVYLAKWAMNVQEESLKTNSKYVLDDTYQNLLNTELGIESLDKLSPLELAQIQRRKPIGKKEWDAIFDNQGRLCITAGEVKDRIFHGGLNNNDGVRKDAWMFLFELFPWDSSTFERQQIIQGLREDYSEYVKKWKDDTNGQWDTEYWRDQKFRIEKDVNRNDRNIDLYKEDVNTQDEHSKNKNNHGETAADVRTANKDQDEDQRDEQAESEDKIDFKNKHLRNLKEILLTYNTFNPNLGYVQGMCDLLSVVYYVFQDNAITFWCFVKFMERMERNFLRDQSGIQKQMVVLNDLIALMLPKLYLHLEKADSTNLFFFFRMLLIWFKREFEFQDVIEIWDNFLTDFYSSQFHLFFALAILSKHEYIILEHLKTMEDILKYMNDLSLTMDKNDLLIRAELLFLRFRKLVEIVDRGTLNEKLNNLRIDLINKSKSQMQNPFDAKRRAGNTDKTGLPAKYEITDNLRLLLSKDIVIEKESQRDPTADTV